MAAEQFSITVLIECRSRDLGLSRAEFVTRAGFKNLAKGIRRLMGLDPPCIYSSDIGGVIRKLAFPLKLPATSGVFASRAG